ncbi:MAG TPA: hypothetical protein VFB93_03850 [Burkholderiales bacterium]|nr:hypothetical protein [Burkholderiales bacterium]
MNESGPAIARYAFTNGVLRGTHLTLHPSCLVHRGDNHLETLPLAAIAALRVAFERDARKLGWGIALLVAALLLLVVAGPLASFANSAAGEIAAASAQGVGRALQGFFRFLEGVASLMPVAALTCVIAGGALGALGWLGSTLLIVSLPGSERLYRVRGRDTMLLDFAEAFAERLMLLKR